MPRIKFQELPNGAPADDSVFPVVTDPSGTPADEKIALSDLVDFIREGDEAVNVAAGNQALSTRKGIVVVSGAPGVARQLTVDDPGAGRGYCLIIHNDSDSDLTVTTGSGTTLVIGTLLSQLVSVTSTGVRNAITGI